MKYLVQMEIILGGHLQQYLHYNPSAPSDLKRLAKDVRTYVKDVQDADMEVFIGHPVNSYLLIWRFLREWSNVGNKLNVTNPTGKGNFFKFLQTLN